MRITGGTLQGRRVIVPPGIIRPSMDRMRESIFGILNELNGLSFLDLFSGSGIIALEAASRGAVYIEAVEADPLKRKILLQNVSLSEVRINCRFTSVELYIKRAKRSFDVIFLDPPFSYKYKSDILIQIAASKLVSNETKILIHHPESDFQSNTIKGLELKDTKKFGRSIVDFFKIKIN